MRERAEHTRKRAVELFTLPHIVRRCPEDYEQAVHVQEPETLLVAFPHTQADQDRLNDDPEVQRQ